MKSDSQIQTDVMQELRWDPSVSHEHVGVSVSEGVVSLSGAVPSFVEKSQAEKAARRVAGVKAIADEIKVNLPGSHKRDDESIAKAIVNAFQWNVQVPENLIKATVDKGWVDLTGEVEWIYQSNAAEKCIRGLSGVLGVSNYIKIRPKNVQPDTIKSNIEAALKREAEQESKRITVKVSGGKVYLTGKVHSFTEMQDASIAAWNSPGVTNVENNIKVSG